MPLGWWTVYVRNSSTSRSAASSRARSSIDCFGCRLRCDDTWPNERSRSISRVPSGLRSPASSARLAAMVVVPTPPLGLNTDTIRRPRGSPMAVTATTAACSRERWKRSDSASTRASSSAWSNGLVMTSSAPASSSADALLEVVGLGDGQDREGLGRLVAAQLLDHGGDRERDGDLVDDDQVVAGRRTRTGRPGRPRSSHRGRDPSGPRSAPRPRRGLSRGGGSRAATYSPRLRGRRSTGTISAGRIQGGGAGRPWTVRRAILPRSFRPRAGMPSAGADPIGRSTAGRAPL